ncbi:MAG: dethiobiotin synthase [Pseudomonadota bacterium]|nr:dethiobiotin synthase [Pseudomonadota bacterium]
MGRPRLIIRSGQDYQDFSGKEGFLKGWFITGTDTGIGKTLIASGLIRALVQTGIRVTAMKPVAAGSVERSGVEIWEDVDALSRAASVNFPDEFCSPYRFRLPVAPHLAAKIEGIRMDMGVLQEALTVLGKESDRVVVEGVGGLMVPFNDGLTMADVALLMGLPVILVVGIRLGCINHALLTYEAIVKRQIPLCGWIANMLDPDMLVADENVDSISELLGCPPLIRVPRLAHLDLEPPGNWVNTLAAEDRMNWIHRLIEGQE